MHMGTFLIVFTCQIRSWLLALRAADAREMIFTVAPFSESSEPPRNS